MRQIQCPNCKRYKTIQKIFYSKLIIAWLLSNSNKMKCKTCGYVWEEKQ